MSRVGAGSIPSEEVSDLQAEQSANISDHSIAGLPFPSRMVATETNSGNCRLRVGGSHPTFPLTKVERRGVSERIHAEITSAAMEMVRSEQASKAQLHVVHIKSVSLLIIATVAVTMAMIYLYTVVVPFILAVFFMLLLEPLLFMIMNPILSCSRRDHSDERWSEDMEMEAEGGDVDENASCQSGRSVFQKMVVKCWSFLAVCTCLVVLFGFCAFVFYMGYEAVRNFPWVKYSNSKNMRIMLEWYPDFGTAPEEFKPENVIAWLLKGIGYDALDVVLSIATQTFLMFLFLAFLLAGDVSSGNSEDRLMVRDSIRRYIRIKTMISIGVAISVCLVYALFEVDLYFFFGVATFVLCYIPHVGNMVAVVVPLIIVFLDPTKSWTDLVIVFIVPFFIHQLAVNLFEPAWLGSSLDLHPVVILLALAFWTTVWGAAGSCLGVPITAVMRMLFVKVDHPYVNPIADLMKGRLVDNPRASDVMRLVQDSPRSPNRGGAENKHTLSQPLDVLSL